MDASPSRPAAHLGIPHEWDDMGSVIGYIVWYVKIIFEALDLCGDNAAFFSVGAADVVGAPRPAQIG